MDIPERFLEPNDLNKIYDKEFRDKLLKYQNETLLNYDVEAFLSSAIGIWQMLKTDSIVICPGDSANKYVTFYSVVYCPNIEEKNIKFVNFPFNCEDNDLEYIQNILKPFNVDNLNDFVFMDYISTGTTLNIIKNAISDIYNTKFEFKQIIDLSKITDCNSIINSESMNVRGLIHYNPKDKHSYTFYGSNYIELNESGETNLDLVSNLCHEQIINCNIFMYLTILKYYLPKKYRKLDIKYDKILSDSLSLVRSWSKSSNEEPNSGSSNEDLNNSSSILKLKNKSNINSKFDVNPKYDVDSKYENYVDDTEYS